MFLEMPLDQPERLIRFYTGAFGWKAAPFPGMQDVWILYSGPLDQPGANLILSRRKVVSQTRFIAEVSDLKHHLERIESCECSVISNQTVDRLGTITLCRDPDGNDFMLMQPQVGFYATLTALAADGMPSGSINRIEYLEIPSPDPDCLSEFYLHALGWQLDSWNKADPYIFAKSGPREIPGINCGFLHAIKIKAPAAIIVVADTDATLQLILELGGSLHRSKRPISGLGFITYVRDPDGNVLGLFQHDRQA